MSNILKGYHAIHLPDTMPLTVTSGGLILPMGSAPNAEGLIRYNNTTGKGELVTRSGVVILGENGTYLERTGGTITGPVTIADGQNITLAGNATIDGVKPSLLKGGMDEMKSGIGIISYTGTAFAPRTLEGSRGIVVSNGNGTANPNISINDFTLTVSGDIVNSSGQPVLITFNGAANASAEMYVSTASSNITDFRERVEDTVGEMFTSGTHRGLTAQYRDVRNDVPVNQQEFGVVDLTLLPYTISLSGVLSGSGDVTSNRDDVVINASLTDAIDEIILRGSQSGQTNVGLRIKYDPATQSSYFDNLSGNTSSSITFRTAAHDGTGQTALTLRDGKLYAGDGTFANITVTGQSSLNTLTFSTGSSSGALSVGGILTVGGTGYPGMTMTTNTGNIGLVWNEPLETVMVAYLVNSSVVSYANFGLIADPIEDYHVGDRGYNDARYVVKTTPVFSGQAVTQNMVPDSNLTRTIGTSIQRYSDVWGQNLHGTVVSGGADVAERYHADAIYQPGTVLVFGGDKEVTVTTQGQDTRIAGIVSTDPAVKMNNMMGSDDTHPFLAITGRVPCKVIGPVSKGGLLVTSSTPGFAKQESNPNPLAVLGRAIQSCGSGEHIIIVQVR